MSPSSRYNIECRHCTVCPVKTAVCTVQSLAQFGHSCHLRFPSACRKTMSDKTAGEQRHPTTAGRTRIVVEVRNLITRWTKGRQEKATRSGRRLQTRQRNTGEPSLGRGPTARAKAPPSDHSAGACRQDQRSDSVRTAQPQAPNARTVGTRTAKTAKSGRSRSISPRRPSVLLAHVSEPASESP